ncbi:MAG: SDR family NAD(P)-dependent oxidoreductase [Acidimicrobiia bacterium]|nr:SDR family NAD(P)-dependent oxidoreductase [Acidimicrobiia bacterium]
MKPSMLTTLADRSVIGGMAGFTKLGYALRARTWAPLPKMDGRTVILTGGTSGLGRAAAEQLAALGAQVVLVGRNENKAKHAVAEIADATGNDLISYELADLSLVNEVNELADRLLASHRDIHVVVNNAGALFNERQETSEGIEISLATNVLSGFVLTNRLLARLKESAPARIVNVSSGGMYTQGVSLGNLQWTRGEYDGTRAYARTKRMQVILTEMWSDMLEGTGVTANAMHPGWADTPGLEGTLPGFHRFISPILRTPSQGADTIAWLAASHEVTWQSGGFYLDREPHVTNVFPGTDLSAAKRQELWDTLSDIAAQAAP